MEIAKRILTKANLDKQLTGQTSAIPFMTIRDGYHHRKVSFDTKEELGDMIRLISGNDRQISNKR